MSRRSPREDRGYTLIELVISIAIMGVILVALASVLMTSVTVDGQTKLRLDGSADIQFAANTFSRDVQNADLLDLPNLAAVPRGPACGSAAGAVALLDLQGTTFDPASLKSASPTVTGGPTPTPALSAQTVSYVQTAGADGSAELRRRTCTAATPGVFPVPGQAVILESVVAKSAKTVTLGCGTAPTVSPSPTVVLTATPTVTPTVTPTSTPYGTPTAALCSAKGATVSFVILGKDGVTNTLYAIRRPA